MCITLSIIKHYISDKIHMNSSPKYTISILTDNFNEHFPFSQYIFCYISSRSILIYFHPLPGIEIKGCPIAWGK